MGARKGEGEEGEIVFVESLVGEVPMEIIPKSYPS